MTFDRLAKSGRKFESADTAFASAILKVAHGTLGRDINLEAEKASKEGRLLRGRQAAFMVQQFFKSAEDAGALYDLCDLLKVKSKNDKGKLQDLNTFLQNWDVVITGMKRKPDEETLEALFREEILHYNQIQFDIDRYLRAKPGDEEHSYSFLYSAAKNYLQRHREDKNRKDVQGKLGGHDVTTAAPAPRKSGSGDRPARSKSKSPSRQGKDDGQKRRQNSPIPNKDGNSKDRG
jgi:hypothetical protein